MHNTKEMHILGIFENTLCILISGARIIVQPALSRSDLQDVIEYGNLPIFNSYEEVLESAYGK
jgi:hypothetical protein